MMIMLNGPSHVQVQVPNDSIGNVIGRAGARINEIRQVRRPEGLWQQQLKHPSCHPSIHRIHFSFIVLPFLARFLRPPRGPHPTAVRSEDPHRRGAARQSEPFGDDHGNSGAAPVGAVHDIGERTAGAWVQWMKRSKQANHSTGASDVCERGRRKSDGCSAT